MNKAPPTRRRWLLHYSLRTLLIAVTLAALVTTFAVQPLRWIWQRHAFLAQWQAAGHNALDATWQAHSSPSNGPYSDDLHIPFRAGPLPRPPSPLEFFGESGVEDIYISVDGPARDALTAADEKKLDQAKRLFPEAYVTIAHFDPVAPQNSWYVEAVSRPTFCYHYASKGK